MRLRPIFASLAFAASAFLAPVASTSARSEQPAAQSTARSVFDSAALFDKVVETIDQRFVDVEMMKRIDWSAKARAARSDIVAAPTLSEAVARINALLAELRTSHTALYTPDDVQYYILLDIIGGSGEAPEFNAKQFWGVGPWYAGIGAFTAKVGDKHFIDGVMEGSPAHQAGLKFGDEIVSVDGAPYSPVAALRNKAGETAALEIRRERDGPTFVVQTPVIPLRPQAAFAAAARASARIIERNGRRIGYIHLWSFNEARSFEAALASIDPTREERRRGQGGSSNGKPLDFLILDARGRVGGNVGAAREVLEILDRGRSTHWGDLAMSGRQGASRSRESANGARSFRGRSALLTNHYTRSAGELVAYGYKRSSLGPVIGAPTAGAVSGGATFLMPGDLLLYVAVGTLEFDGKSLEGEGVAPDQAIDRPMPYANGADPVLDAAIERAAAAKGL